MKFIAFSLLFSFTLLITSCGHQVTREPSAVSIEQIMRQGWKAIPETQQNEIRILGENLAHYIIHASYKTPAEKIRIMQEAEDYFNKSASLILNNLAILTQGKSDELYHLEKAPQWTVKDEVDFLNKSLENTPLPKVGADFDFILKIFAQIPAGLIEEWQLPNAEYWEKSYELLTTLNKMHSDDNAVLVLMDKAEDVLDDYVKDFKNAAIKLSESEEVKFNAPFWEKLVKEFLKDYYQEIDIDIFKNMISDALVLGHQPSEQEVVKIIFNNSGPGLGKTLQQIGREEQMGETMAEMMHRLESEGKPVPSFLAKKIIESDFGGYEFKYIDPTPVGTGTVAQVQRAILMDNGDEVEVAVRFLKPGIEARANSDIKILKKVLERIKSDPAIRGMDVPDLNKLLASLEAFLKADLNIPQTLKNQELADKFYTQSVKVKLNDKAYLIDFHVPKIYKPRRNPGRTKLIVTEFIKEGTKFSKIDDEEAKKVVAQQMMRLWVEEALFRSGYTHADLHEGNFKVLITDDGTRVRISIFDYGMNIQVTKETKRAFILIGGGASYDEPKLVARGLMIFGNDNKQLSEKSLIEIVTNEFHKNGIKNQQQWITWGIKNGFKIPEDLAALTRGGALLNQLTVVADLGGAEVKMVEKFAFKYKVKNFVNDIYDYPLTLKDLFKIGVGKGKKTCADLIKYFFK